MLPDADRLAMNAMGVFSFIASVLTIIQFVSNVLRGRHNNALTELFYALLWILGLLLTNFVVLYALNDSKIIIVTVYLSSIAYLLLSAFTFFGGAVVIWSNSFNLFQYVMLYVVILSTFGYSMLLMYLVDGSYVVASSLCYLFLVLSALMFCERVIFLYVKGHLMKSIANVREKIQESVYSSTSDSELSSAWGTWIVERKFSDNIALVLGFLFFSFGVAINIALLIFQEQVVKDRFLDIFPM